MIKLVLNVGDRVRNINKHSSLYQTKGVVMAVDDSLYVVKYRNGDDQSYIKKLAHNHLEKIEEVASKCKCVHDELCEHCTRQMQKALTFFERYGAGTKSIAEHMAQNRKVLKRERRNVITGMTQSDMHRQHGAAGIVMFNTCNRAQHRPSLPHLRRSHVQSGYCHSHPRRRPCDLGRQR